MEPARPLVAATATDLTALPAAGLAALVRAGTVAAEEVIAAHLRRIGELDGAIRALVAVDGERALAAARRIDERRRRGRPLGPLAGVPFVIKDNMDARGQTTASGSRAHAGVVALRDAVAVARLRAAGAVLAGRANMDELAMGASTRTSAFGATHNPWDLSRSPGGSSGGSAAAVAAGFAALALGTDTGGSIREPAAQCGVLGLAPSPGLVPMAGVVPFAPRLDRLGPLARTADDLALALAVLAGVAAVAPTGPVRVGVIMEHSGAANQPDVLRALARAWTAALDLGWTVLPVGVAGAADALDTYLKITSAACVPKLETYVHRGLAGPEVVQRVELGRRLRGPDARELFAARGARRRLATEFAGALAECDVLLAPTMPTAAPPLSTVGLTHPATAPYTDCWTVAANLVGLPALSLPAGRDADGLPVGVQLTGRPGADGVLLGLAAALERHLSG